MAIPFVFAAQTPEEMIARLLGGPGVAPLELTSSAYKALATKLMATAAATDEATVQMGASWRGLSSDKAQAAFRKHAMWMREQAAVAAESAMVTDAVVGTCLTARAAMGGVAAWLAEFRTKQAITAAAAPLTGGAGTAVLAAEEAEYLAIWAAAEGVMNGYGGALTPLLASFPPPLEAPPIASGAGAGGNVPPRFDFGYSSGPTSGQFAPMNHTTAFGAGPDAGATGPSGGAGPSSDHGGGPGGEKGASGQPSDTGGRTADPGGQTSDPGAATDPTTGGESAGGDLNQMTPETALGDSGTGGGDFAGADPDYTWEQNPGGLDGTTLMSPTLLGLNGGAGSAVSLAVSRGGMGAMSGVSTGFRMPSNWTPAAGRAFGALPAEPASGPPPARQAPRGAVAPKARMRRRRDEERSSSKVFVPGDHDEVPVLEKAPVVGVIEYDDDDRTIESVPEFAPVFGVIEREADESDSIPV